MWAFWANAYGPWFKTPQKVEVKDDDFDFGWWRKCGNCDAKKVGLDQREGYLCYAHPDKKEVEKFIRGFMACRDLAGRFFR